MKRIFCGLIKAIITVIFFYGGYLCLKKSSFFHMYMDHHEMKPHHEMMVDLVCEDGTIIQARVFKKVVFYSKVLARNKKQ